MKSKRKMMYGSENVKVVIAKNELGKPLYQEVALVYSQNIKKFDVKNINPTNPPKITLKLKQTKKLMVR
jgi:hypothetical protein